jgi:hypothetical protein
MTKPKLAFDHLNFKATKLDKQKQNSKFTIEKLLYTIAFTFFIFKTNKSAHNMNWTAKPIVHKQKTHSRYFEKKMPT